MGLVLHDLSMHKPHFTQEQLALVAKLSDSDIKRVNENRGTQNKLGFAYQLCYVKLFNRLPTQSNFEPVEELATFVAVQLDIARELLPGYAQKSTFLHHKKTSVAIYTWRNLMKIQRLFSIHIFFSKLCKYSQQNHFLSKQQNFSKNEKR